MASYDKHYPTPSATQLTETVSFGVNADKLQNLELQEFAKKLEHSQHVRIKMDEINGIISITGKETSISTSQTQIQQRIDKIPSDSIKKSTKPPQRYQTNLKNNRINQMVSETIELSAARYSFLELFGENILNSIRRNPDINSASLMNGKLQLAGDSDTIQMIKSNLEETLDEKNVSITSTMIKHLTLTCGGRLLTEFSEKYHVGTSLHQLSHDGNNKRDNTRNSQHARRGFNATRGRHACKSNSTTHDIKFNHGQQRGAFRGNNRGRGQRGGGNFSANDMSPYDISGVRNLNLNDDELEESDRDRQYDIQNNWYKDQAKEEEEEEEEEEDIDDDDNNSQTSDSDASISSNFRINSTTSSKNVNHRVANSIQITLCSDSGTSLYEAVAELQSYSLHTETWALTVDEFTFISKQKYRGKVVTTSMSVMDRCLQIKYYIRRTTWNHFVHVYVYFLRGMWYVKVKGLKTDVHSAALKIKGSLNNAAETEVHIPISQAMTFFLKTKASSNITKLRKIHNVKITIFSPPARNVNENEQDNSNDYLKLIGCMSRINMAQTAVQDFLGSLSEQEQHFPCDTWDLSQLISKNIFIHLRKIQESDDYEAVGLIKFYNSEIERQQTTPKITFTIVSIKDDTTNEVIQQCKDIIEGYVTWKPSSNEYRALVHAFFVQKRPNIEQFQQEWGTKIQLDRQTNTVIIFAQSKMIADEIKKTLQSLALGPASQLNNISVIIPIELNIRRFITQAIQPTLNEARNQKVFIDSKNWSGLILHGRSEVIDSIQEKINTIIKDIKHKIVTNRLKLTFAESELFRTKSYEIITRIENETNTIIRDVQFTKKEKLSNVNNNDETNLTLACVVNNRGQIIVVKKSDITKIKDIDAMINPTYGSLNPARDVDKTIAAAAGPALTEECKNLIAKQGGAALPPGKAVKTTAGQLPYKGIIHAIGPRNTDDFEQKRILLFFSILSSLQLAEQEGYNSIALPAISAATSNLPLEDWASIIIRAIKQFFADFSKSCLRKVILLDMDDSVCNSFASEIMNDHTHTTENNNDNNAECNLPPLTPAWYWQDDTNEKIYNDKDTRQLETAFQQYLHTLLPSTLKLIAFNQRDEVRVCYSIHFLERLGEILKNNPNALNNRIVCGYQMRESTNFKREIIRYSCVQQKQSKSITYRTNLLDVYQSQTEITGDDWEITGMTNKTVNQAEIAIRKAIETATIEERFSINLNQDIDTHETAIRNIAMQQLIQVDFEEDHREKLTLILKGLKQNVSEAKLQIALYVQGVLTMLINKDDELSIPKEWGDQEEEYKLVELSRNQPDFVRIENRMKETMNKVKIHKIERIQNLRLWNRYALSRRSLRQELSHKPDLEIEMELFHGTRNTPPDEIYNGDCGFDMRFSSDGLWGKGSYFARNAAYSCQSYSYQLPDGKRQVFLAHVLTGEVYDYKDQNDPSLRLPPKKNASVSGVRYDSVSGKTGGSRVYIVYDTRVTYPTFLITFS